MLVGSLTACVTEGSDFSSNTSWITAGRTSQADVRNIMKEPYSVGNAYGKPTWTYGYYRYKLIGKSEQKELKFYWKADGTVESYSFSSSFPDDTTTKPPGKSGSSGAQDNPQY
jgi:hypothetical protein